MPRSKNNKRKLKHEDPSEDHDNVEAFRAGRRHQEREAREVNEGEATQMDYEKERQLRMQRLRQELQEEDEEIAEKMDEKTAASVPKQDNPQEKIVEVKEEDLEGLDEEEQMRKLMGIDGFGTTKGKKVEDNHSTSARGVVQKNKARKYRQYMNRKNGFNRPLEKMN
jgi:U4/U6.U5 tri-snRNP-associated protein 3